ncbi:MAG: 1-phosphofructokinase family hexose kinase [Candidatus Goldbacteria bacterium]|nr:1-phosphofructokinase family hexose kinase [Candidatus Goldiibacteriota bacterium]
MITTVNLNSTIDIVIPLPDLKLSSVTRTPWIAAYPGGKGTNVARALANLGSHVVSTGFCGSNDFESMKSFLEQYMVKSDFIKVSGSNRPCIIITETIKKRETIINSESSFKITKNAIIKFLNKLNNLSKNSKIIIFSGSLPLSLPVDFYFHAIKSCNKNCFIILDTSAKYLRYGIKAGPSLIKQNLDELQSAFNVRLNTKTKIKKFCFNLLDKYKLKAVIVTLHQKGAILFENNNSYFFPSIKIKNAISPVGSGDAFTAGLAFGIESWNNIKESIKFAISCATANLQHFGSCFFTAAEARSYIKKVKILNY